MDKNGEVRELADKINTDFGAEGTIVVVLEGANAYVACVIPEMAQHREELAAGLEMIANGLRDATLHTGVYNS